MAFGLLAIVQMSLIAAISLVSVALPAMQQELGLGEIQLTLISAGYGLAFSGLLILGGRLGDAVGPTFTFVTGMTIFGVASGTAGFAPGFGPLLVARFAQGVGAALAAPAALTLAGALFTDPDQRTRALAAWGGLSATGAVAGMLLSGAIVAWLGWRWVFAPPTTVAALALIAAPRVVPGAYFAPVSRLPPAPRLAPDRGVTPGEGGAEPPRLDIIGSVLITTGLSALTYGLLALASGGSLGTAWAVTGLGVALVVLFVRVESRARHPLVPMAFFKERRRRLALVTIVAASAASAATSFFLSLFLQQVRGLSALQTSAYFIPDAPDRRGRGRRRTVDPAFRSSMGGGAGRGPGRH